MGRCENCRYASGMFCTRVQHQHHDRGWFRQSYETKHTDDDFCGPQRRYFEIRALKGKP